MEIEFLIPTNRVVEFKRAVKEGGSVKILKMGEFSEGTFFMKTEINNPYDLVAIGVLMGINQCYDSIGYQEAKAATRELIDKVQEFVDQNKK